MRGAVIKTPCKFRECLVLANEIIIHSMILLLMYDQYHDPDLILMYNKSDREYGPHYDPQCDRDYDPESMILIMIMIKV